jgi:hypothetical protein
MIDFGLWSLPDGRRFGWSPGGPVAADDALQAELDTAFALPARVMVPTDGPNGIGESLELRDPGTLEHADAVARGLGARREL